MCAIRMATCLAAIRLGSSMRILPVCKAPCNMVSGSSVDFPAPGGAVMTNELCVPLMLLLTFEAMSEAGK